MARPLTLIAADNEFLASLELARLRAGWEKKGYATEEISADEAEAVLGALDTPALFGDGRLVLARGAATALEPHAERLKAWAANPPEKIIAILVLTKTAKIMKALGNAAEVIAPSSPKPWETADWLVRFAKGRGRIMKKDAADALVEILGGDLRELAVALEQVETASSATIDVATVRRLFRGRESALYTFLDAVLARDLAGTLAHLHALIRSGEHPLVLHAALAKQVRALAAARDAQGEPPAALARSLDLSVGYANRAQKHGRNFDAGEIRRAFRLLADADLALKGGGEDQPGDLVLELALTEICGDARRAAAARRR